MEKKREDIPRFFDPVRQTIMIPAAIASNVKRMKAATIFQFLY